MSRTCGHTEIIWRSQTDAYRCRFCKLTAAGDLVAYVRKIMQEESPDREILLHEIFEHIEADAEK